MFTKPLPRFVITKTLAGGATAFYFNVPTLYRKLGCTIWNEPLGMDYAVACGETGEGGRAATLNALFDEWNTKRKGGQVERWASRPLRDGGLAVPRIQAEQGVSRKGRSAVSARLRAHYAFGRRYCHEAGRQNRRWGFADHAGARRQNIRHHLKGPRGRARGKAKRRSLMSSGLACRPSAVSDPCSRRSEPMGGGDEEAANEGDQGRGDTRQVYTFAWGASNLDTLNRPRPQSSALNGCSGPKCPGRLSTWQTTATGIAPCDRIEHHKTGALVCIRSRNAPGERS